MPVHYHSSSFIVVTLSLNGGKADAPLLASLTAVTSTCMRDPITHLVSLLYAQEATLQTTERVEHQERLFRPISSSSAVAPLSLALLEILTLYKFD